MIESPIIVGICGISQSGKSTLATDIKNSFLSKDKTVELFEIDNYMKQESLIPKIKDHTDWEHPESVDWTRLIFEINESLSDIIIVEGIFAFQSQLNSLYSVKILMDLDYETFIQRRSGDTRWGKDPKWYLDHVWQSNQQLFHNIQPDIRLNCLDPDCLSRAIATIKTCQTSHHSLNTHG